ncbi:uncharacterized protein LOC102810266 [Saccoglossus kowalevskii]|uniref:Uncharacterized protein LOC102810266 n=1 Tax=Saccoglossus kowalevskii TaxID=10224 RepID=A0ABM0M362_SACKO|nr:PREDICTED: uncharacterized protein LOC102810266 [Saccoglossus kowalevskii]
MIQQTKAAVLHYASTSEKPKGNENWCKWQQDLAMGSATYRPLKKPLPAAVVDTIWPIVEKLSSENLLEGVKNGLTQNANESCHHCLWSYLPKETNHGYDEVRLGFPMAVAHFNSGMNKFNTNFSST